MQRARDLINLQQTYQRTAQKYKLPPTSQQLIELICERPVINAGVVQKSLGVTWDGANKAIQNLEKVGMLTETTGAKRNKLYIAKEILDILQ